MWGSVQTVETHFLTRTIKNWSVCLSIDNDELWDTLGAEYRLEVVLVGEGILIRFSVTIQIQNGFVIPASVFKASVH